MDLKKKLSRLSGAGLKGASPRAPGSPVSEPTGIATTAVAVDAQDPRIERLRRGLATLPARNVIAPAPTRNRAASRELPGETRETPHGTVHLRECVFEPWHRHGEAEVRAALEAESGLVAALALDPRFREVDLRRMLLLDTETTGLAGGTGTLPFVIGLGWFEADRLRVQQLVLRRPGEELPILRVLEERLAGASCLVTYNGKTFDWPLLRNRFVMNRLTVPAPKPHLDLLHCARRVFRHRTSGSRLVQLEEEVLGFRRVDDVPGDLIPDLYFRYLRTGNGGLIAPVLEHNQHDMVLLAALLGVMVRQFRDANTAEIDPRDQLGFASVAARTGDAERALAFARGAARAEDRNVCAEALALAANVARRRGEVTEAVRSLEAAVKVASGVQLSQLHLELAKLYEHRVRDLDRALDHARHTQLAEGAAANAQRLARLERRLRAIQAKNPSGQLPLGG